MTAGRKRGGRAAPVITLLLLAPIAGELLFGSTRLTAAFALVPQVGTWGCAALLIRHFARGRGWGCVLLLGLALAVAEECVIQQTSLAPLVGADPQHIYSRALGVNWVYLLWALGYASAWIVLLPIQLTELIFPDRREEPWIGRRGTAIAAVVFALASLLAWYTWTQVFVPKFFPQSAYTPPLPTVAIALGAIALLAAIALTRRPLPRRPEASAPGPWPIGLLAFIFAVAWSGMALIAYGVAPRLPAGIPIVLGLALAALALALLRRWTAAADWRDAHRCALVIGALSGSMAGGFAVLVVGAAGTFDVVGKLVLNVVALLLLVRLARRVGRDPDEVKGAPTPAEC